ncbi:MAG: CHAD domain-containing protein [Bacteroidetes bacterium]|nr:CHAD domain-containing protein [Bacteroidota bacterium]
MKIRVKLERYIEKRAALIDSFFQKSQQDFVAKDYHQFRVEIKKVSACLRVVAYCHKHFMRKKYYEPYREVFKQAGKIRELQVQETILKKYKRYASLKTFASAFRRSLSLESATFFSMLTEALRASLEENKKEVKPFLEKIHETCVLDFLKSRKKKIDGFLQRKDIAPVEMHKFRKWLKDFGYISKLLYAEKYQVKKHDLVQKLIGEWRDQDFVSRNLQTAFYSGDIPEAEKKNIKKLEKAISAKANRLLSKIWL